MGLVHKTKFSKNHSSAGRKWGFNRIYGAEDGKETPYMTRLWVWRLRFHLFHRGDEDPDCHDHPWGFWTFPLRSYVEEVLEVQRDAVAETKFLGYDDEGLAVYDTPEPQPTRYFRRRQIVKAFRLHYRPATHRHRVLGLWNRQWERDFPPGSYEDDPERWELADPAVKAGTIPTFVFTEKPHRKWGFTKQDPTTKRWCWVPWRRYVYDGGKTAPCAEIEKDIL